MNSDWEALLNSSEEYDFTPDRPLLRDHIIGIKMLVTKSYTFVDSIRHRHRCDHS